MRWPAAAWGWRSFNASSNAIVGGWSCAAAWVRAPLCWFNFPMSRPARASFVWRWLFLAGLAFGSLIVIASGKLNLAVALVTLTPTTPPPLKAIVFVRPEPETGADSNVWIMHPDGSNETQLTRWADDDVAPVLSPNGYKVAYYSRRNNSWTLWVMNSNGTNPVQLALAGDNVGAPAWSPDGAQIAFSNDSQDWWEIWVVNADGANPHRLTTHPGAAAHPSWSPDGTRL